MNYAIILAGGVGNRLGAGIPKQFVEVLGKPVIAYTMQIYQDHPEIDGIELVCVDGFQDRLARIAEDNHITKVMKIVKGGTEYEKSIMNGVAGLDGIAKPDDVVMIHWAASPFASAEIVSDNIRVCKEKGNAMSASPCFLYERREGGEGERKNINRYSFSIFPAPKIFKKKHSKKIKKGGKSHSPKKRGAPTPAIKKGGGDPNSFTKRTKTNTKTTKKRG